MSTNDQTTIDVAEELMQTSRNWCDAIGRGDLEGTFEFWSEDAIINPPGVPPLDKKGMRNFVEESLKDPNFSIYWEPRKAYVSEYGDMGYILEQMKVTASDEDGNPQTSYNNTVTIWRKQPDGTWKCVMDTWNDDPQGEF